MEATPGRPPPGSARLLLLIPIPSQPLYIPVLVANSCFLNLELQSVCFSQSDNPDEIIHALSRTSTEYPFPRCLQVSLRPQQWCEGLPNSHRSYLPSTHPLPPVNTHHLPPGGGNSHTSAVLLLGRPTHLSLPQPRSDWFRAHRSLS